MEVPAGSPRTVLGAERRRLTLRLREAKADLSASEGLVAAQHKKAGPGAAARVAEQAEADAERVREIEAAIAKLDEAIKEAGDGAART